MATASLTPQGVDYTHDAASNAYDDQIRWIDALDTKAGILMAADGVIAALAIMRWLQMSISWRLRCGILITAA